MAGRTIVDSAESRPIVPGLARGEMDRGSVCSVSSLAIMQSALVVISHYNAWPTDKLVALLNQIREIPSGHPFRCLVVVNRAVDRPLELPAEHASVEVLYRENTGYNIGAWEYGWRKAPRADYYLFLQEECRIVRPDWLGAFVRKLSRPGVGLVGEIMAWRGLNWKRLEHLNNRIYQVRRSNAAIRRFQFIDGVQAVTSIPRVSRSARPVSIFSRSSLATRREVLEAIDGFMIGHTKGDAICVRDRDLPRGGLERVDDRSRSASLPFRFIRPSSVGRSTTRASPRSCWNGRDRYAPLSMIWVTRNSIQRLRKLITGIPCDWETPASRTDGRPIGLEAGKLRDRLGCEVVSVSASRERLGLLRRNRSSMG